MSLIPNIKLNVEQDEEFNYGKIYENCLVNLSEEIMLPPTALSIGEHSYKGNLYSNNTFSYGEFSAIVAASKTKKTFFKSALIASYIGGQSSNYFPNFKSFRDDDYYIVDIDTEQGEYYAQRAFRRVTDLVGKTYDNYLPFGLEGLDGYEIIQFIQALLEDPRYKGKIKWMSIDGIADLLDNTNDIVESNAIAKRLKVWRKKYQMHINTVIHRTKQSQNATGHLGSFIEKKSETVILLRDTEEDPIIKNSPIEVIQTYSRGAPFDPFFFKLNEDTLPIQCELNNNW
jgi:hypothetical protein